MVLLRLPEITVIHLIYIYIYSDDFLDFNLSGTVIKVGNQVQVAVLFPVRPSRVPLPLHVLEIRVHGTA